MTMDRRDFLYRVGGATAASGALRTTAVLAKDFPSSATAPLPTISLGAHRITRLIVGSNPINGNSYLGAHMDQHMREYFTVDRAVEFLTACEKAGINTHQFSTHSLEKAAKIAAGLRERDSNLKLIALADHREDLREHIRKTRPIAVAHHGGTTDRLFSQGKGVLVHDYVKAVHDEGLLAGVSSHNPEFVQRMADEDWEVDFFMTCFYFVSRHDIRKPTDHSEPDTLELGHAFYRNDPPIMARVIRQVKKPCLAFKILAAGRKCADQPVVRAAFRFAYENIKGGDAVIVGMYPRFFDEIHANVEYARQFANPQGPRSPVS
jgi:hypothetical protein